MFVVPLLAACGASPVLGEPDAAPASSLLVLTRETSAPPLASPPPGVTVIGDFYLIRADRDALLPSDDPATVTLPVPDGIDGEALQITKIVPAASFLDGATSGDRWLLFDATYDPGTRTVSTTTLGVSAGGDRYALIERTDASSLPAKPVVQTQFDFYPECLEMTPAQCTPALLQGFAELLTEVRGELKTMGFPEPRLRLKTIDGNPNHAIGFMVYLAPPASAHCVDDESDPVLGIFHAIDGILIVCATADVAGGFPYEMRPTVVHEYFHATQYGFERVLNGRRREPFLIEGTATMSELSYTNEVGTGELVSRTAEYDLHRVDIALPTDDDAPGGEDKLYEYAAQDFWVYTGRRLVRDLDYLLPIFAAGGGRYAVDRNLGATKLGEMYWGWVNNFTFTREIDYYDGTSGQCLLDYKSVAPPTDGETEPGTPWRQFPVGTPYPHFGSLPPLATHVVRLVPIDGYPVAFEIKESLRHADIRYKVFLDGVPPCGDDLPEGKRRLTAQEVGPYSIYVVISNVSLSENRNYRLDSYPVEP